MMVAPLPCHILDTGYCLANEAIVIRGGRPRHIACHSIVALLEHPVHGWLLWDAGYAPYMLAATRRFPYRMYRWATPLHLQPELAVTEQLSRFGLSPTDIRLIILSHFHADHIAGLRDFPNARFVATAEAYSTVTRLRGLAALRRGFIPELLPPDFSQRCILLPTFTGAPIAPLGASHDLFADGSIRLVQLPGHARGQIGMFVHTVLGECFFVADSVWLTRSIIDNCPPARLADFIADDPAAVRATIARLHQFVRQFPHLRIIPSHCPEAFVREVTAA